MFLQKKFRDLKLHTKLTSVFILLITASIFSTSLVTFRSARRSLTTARIASLEAIADLKVGELERLFKQIEDEIKAAQHFFIIKTHLPTLVEFDAQKTNPLYLAAKKTLDNQLKNIEKVFEVIDNVILTGPDGKIVYVSDEAHTDTYLGNFLPDPANRAFEEGRKGVHFTDVFMNPFEGNKLGMVVTAPAYDFDNQFIGVIAFDIDMDPVYRLIQDTTGLGASGETLIGKRMGHEVLFLNPLRHDPEAALKRKLSLGERDGGPIQRAVQRKNGSGIARDYRGREVLAVWRYVSPLDWGMVAKIDTSEAFAAIEKVKEDLVFMTLVILIAAWILALLFSGTVTRPVKRLVHAAHQISQGRWNLVSGTDSRDEVGLLAQAFNYMVKRLEEAEAKLRRTYEGALGESEQKFQTVVESTPNGILLADSEGKIQLVNAQVEKIFGFPREELVGQPVEVLVPWGIRERHSGYRVDYTHKKPPTQIMGEGREIKGLRKDGTEVPVEIGLASIRTSKGIFVLATITDISQRRELEKRAFAAERLAAMGKMSSHIAHEVRNPLSSVSLNLDLLHDELAVLLLDNQTEQAKEIQGLLRAIQREVDRLADLAGEYLKFSRPPEQRKERVDLNEFLGEITDFLREEARKRGIEMTLQSSANSLVTFIDPQQMQQVFLNLIRNAFDALPSGGRVEIGLRPEEETVVVFIRDEGVGMDEATRQRIFDPFFTTKGHGTGLGLVVSHQVVTEHGGVIWCESEKGKGTTFFIRFPAIPKEVIVK